MFVQKLNPLTGEADWVLVNDPGLGDKDDASADLVATSSYLDMLTDSRRNAAYAAALRRVIPAVAKATAAKAAKANAAAEPADAAAAAGTATAAAAATTGAVVGRGVRVLDIGTGTGLLAMMAARTLEQLQPAAGSSTAAPATAAATDGAAAPAAATAGAAGDGKGDGKEALPPDAPPSAPVAACEVFPPMQNLSRKVIAANGLSPLIRVVNKRSDEMVVRPPPGAAAAAAAATAGAAAAAPTPQQQRLAAARARAAAAAAGGAPGSDPDPIDMYERVDVVVTEIFDSELLGEGMIPTMRHAVQHLIKEGGVVIPAHSRVYGQVVECPTMHHMAGLRRGGSGAGGSSTSGGGGGSSSTAVDAAATAAAGRVLDVLGQLDGRARAALHGGGGSEDDMYEVREMHVDLLHEYDVRRGALAAAGSFAAPDPSSSSSAAAAAAASPVAPQQAQAQQQLSIRPLSEPFLMFDFDWLRPPPPSGRKTRVRVPATAAGSAHAVLLWWQLGMTPADSPAALDAATAAAAAATSATATAKAAAGEATEAVAAGDAPPPPLLLSTAPRWLIDRGAAGGDGGPSAECGLRQGWRDHWKQCWVQLAAEAPALAPGQVLTLAFEHDDVSLRGKMVGGGGSSDAAVAAAAGATADAPAAPAVAPAAAPAGKEAAGGGSSGSSNAKEVLAALRAEAAERQQLIPLMGCLGPQALWQLGDEARLATFSAALQRALEQAGAAPAAAGAEAAQPEAGGGGGGGAGGGGAGGGSAGGGGAEVVVVDGSLALGLLAAAHPAVASVTLLQESSMAVGEWIAAAAARLGAAAAAKIRPVRAEAYFKRLAAGGGGGGAKAAAAASSASSSSQPGKQEQQQQVQQQQQQQQQGQQQGQQGPLVLLAEPYFSEFEQLVPWAHLRFWRDYDVIRGSAVTAAAAVAAGGGGATAKRGGGAGAGAKGGRRRRVVCLPARARLMAVAVSLPELYRTRTALGRIEGLDLSPANNVLGVVGGGGGGGDAGGGGKAKRGEEEEEEDADVRGDEDDDEEAEGDAEGAGGRQPLPILPYAMWQAGGGYRELSARTPLLTLDCTGHLGDVEGEAVLQLLQPQPGGGGAGGVGGGAAGQQQGEREGEGCVEVHAVVLWLEYDLLTGGEEEEEEGGSEERGRSGSRRLVVSTGPCPLGGPGPAVQGVHLLPQPLRLAAAAAAGGGGAAASGGDVGSGGTCPRLHVAAEFDGLDADVSVTVTPLP
ncbi:hypothetical protein HXX76_014314 [Chlamydomonas incerta]|uniref:type I protein arginine methyltransferase n=1 Tax=Chlamydomonas incerta TaxID=51695 RepID=A0A835SFT8_CHLIN|nr:hypothetical protein HXX76_014314 [Chlamydomonas incerta]|eukprot:KAG2424741.1 hypothetical protein HXX76_014314 [Chlamydomonas incerta]